MTLKKKTMIRENLLSLKKLHLQETMVLMSMKAFSNLMKKLSGKISKNLEFRKRNNNQELLT